MDVSPTIFVAVPRVTKDSQPGGTEGQSFPQRAIYRWALSVGREHLLRFWRVKFRHR